MTYSCQYKRGQRINLEKVGVISTAQAIEKALEVLNNINKGIEPAAHKGINKSKTLQEFIENEYNALAVIQPKKGEKKHLDH